MKRKLLSRLLVTSLSVAMLLSISAQALTLEDTQDLLVENYVNTVPDSVLEQPDIDSMLAALGDPYTVYYSAEDYAAFLATMEDSTITGIGVTSTITTEGALVESVFEGSPAAEGGLTTGDLITAVDGETLAGLDTLTITELLRGEIGSTVRITYRRSNRTTSVTLTRAEIIIPATSTTLINDHIGYIDCTTFGSDTYLHFVEGFEEYGSEVDRWILDLTGNSGGDVYAATQAVSCFTGTSFAAFLQDAQGEYSVYAPSNSALTLYPVIALTDSASASAAELYAAAVRDLNAGIVVGWRTFGKGVAQVLLDETTHPDIFDGDALKVTSYRFYSSNGNATDTIGVIPHLMVDPNLADDVAVLLSNSNASGDNSNLLRVDFSWRWIVDLDLATSEEYLPAFTALLEAMPSTIALWEGAGNISDWNATTVEDLAETYGLELEDRGFTDTADSPYAQEIDLLATYYILQGMGDGTYAPTEELTRGQLCSLLAQALNCRVSDGASTFVDVPSDHIYSDAIQAIADMGLVNGITEDTFAPDEPVTHEQFITIMGRLIETLNMNMDNTQLNRSEDALDNEALSTYSSWAQPQVWLLGQSQSDFFGNTINLLWDDVSAIDPTATTTREEAAYLLYSVLSYIDILPV